MWGSPTSPKPHKSPKRNSMVRLEAREWFHTGGPASMRNVSSGYSLQGVAFLSTPLQGGILKPPALRVVDDCSPCCSKRQPYAVRI